MTRTQASGVAFLTTTIRHNFLSYTH